MEILSEKRRKGRRGSRVYINDCFTDGSDSLKFNPSHFNATVPPPPTDTFSSMPEPSRGDVFCILRQLLSPGEDMLSLDSGSSNSLAPSESLRSGWDNSGTFFSLDNAEFWNLSGDQQFPAEPVAPAETAVPVDVPPPRKNHMEWFPAEKVNDFKHLLYNLLADNYNNPEVNTLVQPFTVVEAGETRTGFRFNPLDNPERKLPELYAQHIKKARLDLEDQKSVFIQDIYKFYMRACVELMSKYFHKRDKYTYLYDDVMLFQPGGTLEQAEKRLSAMKSRSRKRKMSVTD